MRKQEQQPNAPLRPGSEPQQDTIDLSQVAGGGDAGIWLLLYHRGGVEVVPMDDGKEVVVGRAPFAEIALDDLSISRRHARFSMTDGEVHVEDLGSTNATRLDGQEIDKAILKEGSEIAMGSVTAVLQSIRRTPTVVDPTLHGKPGQLRDTAGTAMRAVYDTIERISASDIPVLVQGETGVGKEVVARAIHAESQRAGKPMLCLNCGAIPSQLVESTLFGHERGAFTGAEERKAGVFEAANGGTVFLDEIGELPIAAQAALLRVLEAKCVTRVGSTEEIPVDARIIAASNRDLEDMCATERFRWDLLYRLNAMTIRVPPLRQRVEEIPSLSRALLAEAMSGNTRGPRDFDEKAMQLILTHSWPGNVRELKNVVERAAVLAKGPVITEEDLPDRLRPMIALPRPAIAPSQTGAFAPVIRVDENNRPQFPPFKAYIRQCEVDLISAALQATNGNRTEAAKLLQMPLRTLVYKIKHLDIQVG